MLSPTNNESSFSKNDPPVSASTSSDALSSTARAVLTVYQAGATRHKGAWLTTPGPPTFL